MKKNSSSSAASALPPSEWPDIPSPAETKPTRRRGGKARADGEAKPRKNGKAANAAAQITNSSADATRPLDASAAGLVPNHNDSTDPLTRPDDVLGATVPLQGSDNLLELLDRVAVTNRPVLPQVLTSQGIECAYASDVGQLRNNNEDSVSAFIALLPSFTGNPGMPYGFFVVADGMGGYERGEVASQLTVQTVVTSTMEEIYLRAINGEAPGMGSETPAEVLVRIIGNANNLVMLEASRERSTMGTTIVCALLIGNLIYVGNVGDSRLYAIQRNSGVMEQITTDHSVVQRLVEMGQMSPEEAAASPKRSVLYRSLGQVNFQPADVAFLQSADYSDLLLCSDGLWEMVDDVTIARILRESVTAELACRRLINAANQNGGDDNVTAVVIKLKR